MSIYPTLRPDDGHYWTLTHEWSAVLPILPCKRLLIHSGFKTDGATIPMWAWSIIGHPFDGEFIRAALAHDALYTHHGLRRITADKAFKAILAADGTPHWKANMMYAAVRAMGGAAWKDPQRLKSARYIEIIPI